ncbi:hypothetical protein Ahy_A06g029133 isoform C [Arachis hypogaea]|uniref:Uncharacterized protein n=1 Tax=Arachis hypogaea TaxID=3818 RepID=A0A445CSH8_ARAHY|nr:hypothetical protein Ahy_A06g029133 isoform C [Arachis hypogaea]
MDLRKHLGDGVYLDKNLKAGILYYTPHSTLKLIKISWFRSAWHGFGPFLCTDSFSALNLSTGKEHWR